MRINLHKNARTAQDRHELIQETPDMNTSGLATSMGTGATAPNQWPKKNSFLETPPNPTKTNTALDLRQEVAAVCARLSLRSCLDDLWALVHLFVSQGCSRSSLNKSLKHYNVSRLPALNRAWPKTFRKDKGTCFYYSRIHFPARLFAAFPIVVDLMVDSVCRWVCLQATSPPHAPALPFIKEVIEHFPIPVSTIIAEQPLALMNSDLKFRDESRRHLHMVKQLCRIQGVTCRSCHSMAEETRFQLEESCRRLTVAGIDIETPLNGHGHLKTKQRLNGKNLSERVSGILDAYVDTSFKSLGDQSPRQAMMAHYQEYPEVFRTLPEQSCGTWARLKLPGR